MKEEEILFKVHEVLEELEGVSCVESQDDVINYERYDTRDDEEKNIPELAELTGNVEIYYQYQEDEEVTIYEKIILAGRYHHRYDDCGVYALSLKTNDYNDANEIVSVLNEFCENILDKKAEWYVGCPYEEYVYVD